MAFRAHPFDQVFPAKKPLPVRHVSKAPPPDPEVDELRKLIPSADGKVLVPGKDAAAAELLPFNLRTTITPRVIVSCKTARCVSLALGWARQHGVTLRSHSGGHAYEGYCSGTGLMIDVRPMTGLSINAAGTRVVVGAGHRTLALTTQLAAKGVAIPLGTCAPVGIAGVTLGGGHGLSSRKFGLTLDNVRSIRLVQADGAEVVASAAQNADLFWALRGGGGGNFGIVTEFEFNVHKVDRVILFRITWRADRADAVINAWQNFMHTAPDEISSVLVVGGSGGKVSGIRCAGQFLPRKAGQVPDPTELANLLRPLTNIPTLENTLKATTFLGAAKYFSGSGDTKRVFFKAKSDYALQPLNAAARAALLKALAAAPQAVDVIMESYGGAVNRVAPEDTAFPHRGTTRFCMQYFAEWSAPSSTVAKTNAVRAVHQAMRPHLPGRCYVNYADQDLTNWADAYYGSNLPRLQQVKKTYDPTNLFQFPQSIE